MLERPRRLRRYLRCARNSADARTRLHARRRQDRRAAGRGADASGLGARVWLGSARSSASRSASRTRATRCSASCPPGWKYPVEDADIDYFMPLEPLVQQFVTRRAAQSFTITGRLKPGVSVQQANAEIRAISLQLAQQYPETNQNRLVARRFAASGRRRRCAAGVARHAGRGRARAADRVRERRESSPRACRGPQPRDRHSHRARREPRTMIVRQLLAESFLLALLGGAGGMLLAWWGIDVLSALGPRGVPRLGDVRIDATVCAFTFGLADAEHGCVRARAGAAGFARRTLATRCSKARKARPAACIRTASARRSSSRRFRSHSCCWPARVC